MTLFDSFDDNFYLGKPREKCKYSFNFNLVETSANIMVLKLIDINLHLRAQRFFITFSSLNFDNDKNLFFNCYFFFQKRIIYKINLYS